MRRICLPRFVPLLSFAFVLSGTAVADAQTFTVNGSSDAITVYRGTTLTVNAGSGSTNSDWVGLHAVGAANTTYLDWWYLNGTKSLPGSPVSNATFTFAINQPPGTYELRKFHNNGFTQIGSDSGAITVSPPLFTVNGVAAPQSVTVAPSAAAQIGVNGGQGHAQDWVGIFRLGAADGSYLDWAYLNGLQSVPPVGLHTAAFTMRMPIARGPYEFRWFHMGGKTTSGIVHSEVRTIAAGGDGHTLIVRPDGTVRVSGLNAAGQLGDDSTIDKTTPIPVPGLSDVVSVAAGVSHSMALTASGTVYTWGANNEGQIGDETNTPRLTPTVLSSLTDVVAIAAGEHHGVALTTTGQVFTWGDNAVGQLGNGSTTDSNVPVQIASGAVAIAAGDRFTLYVKTDGTVWGTGDNEYGALGWSIGSQTSTPVQMFNVTNAAAVRAGKQHSLILLRNGGVLATGRNHVGQLGWSGSDQWTAQSISTLSNIIGIAAGDHFSLALDTNGLVWSWGDNASGQLGVSTPSSRATPETISGLSDISAIAVGGSHAMAIDTNGMVFTFGLNSAGQLGNATTTSQSAPSASTAFSWRVGTPTLSVVSGTYDSSFNVTVTAPTDGSTMRYTQNGSDPAEADPTVASGATIAIAEPQTLKVKAWKSGFPSSAVAAATYQIKVAAPTFSPGTGTYLTATSVTLASATSGATVRYTLDGSDPTAASTAYTEPITVSTGGILKAAAFKSNWADSNIGSSTYTFNFGTLATPTASPAGGVYAVAPAVTLSGPAGATIRYSLDGSEPSAASTLYTAPVQIPSGTTTIKARAFHPDWTQSPVGTSTYTIDTTAPTITARVWPVPNAAGWNNTPVTITYMCADNVLVGSCPAPVVVAADGPDQLIQRTATDGAGNTASSSVTISIDTVPPVVALTTPANPSTTTSATVSVTGTTSDALSGLGSVGCNGTATALSGTIGCDVAVRPGRNAVVVHVRDGAGNAASAGAYVNRTGPVTQMSLSPTTRTVVLNGTVVLALHDEFGVQVSQATWSSSNTGVVTVSADDPPVLTGIAVGTAVITATKSGVSATATLTVVTTTALVDGSPQWSVAPGAGLTMGAPIFANVVTDTSPDIYLVESGSTETRVTGATVAGSVLSTETVPGAPLMGDSFGGLIVGVRHDPSNAEFLRALVRTGTSTPWRYEGFVSGTQWKPAQAPNGTIYAIEYVDGGIVEGNQFWDLHAIVIDGTNGQLLQRVPLRREIITFTSENPGFVLSPVATCDHALHEFAPVVSGPIVGEDGRGYLLVRRRELHKSGSCRESDNTRPARTDDGGVDLFVLSAAAPPAVTSVLSNQCTSSLGQASLCDFLPNANELNVVVDGLGGTFVSMRRLTSIAGTQGSPEYVFNRFVNRFDESQQLLYSVQSDAAIYAVGQNGFVIADIGGGLRAAIDATDFHTMWTTSALGWPLVLSPNGASFHDLFGTGELKVIEAGQLIRTSSIGPGAKTYYRGRLIAPSGSGVSSLSLTNRVADSGLFEQGTGNQPAQKAPRQLCAICHKGYRAPAGKDPIAESGGRRVLTIAFDGSWDQPNNPGSTEVRIFNAFRDAIKQWNETRDAFGNHIGYFIKIDSAHSLGTPDMTVKKAVCRSAGAYACHQIVVDGQGDNHAIPSTLIFHAKNLTESTVRDEDLLGRAAHEIGHKLGGHGARNCDTAASIMRGEIGGGRRVINSVWPLDVELMNQARLYPNSCTGVANDGELQEPWEDQASNIPANLLEDFEMIPNPAILEAKAPAIQSRIASRAWNVSLFISLILTLLFGQGCRDRDRSTAARPTSDAPQSGHLVDVAAQALKRGDKKVGLRELAPMDTESSLDTVLENAGVLVAQAAETRQQVTADSIFTWQLLTPLELIRPLKSQPAAQECDGPTPPFEAPDRFVLRLAKGATTINGVEVSVVDEEQIVFENNRRYLLLTRECPGRYLVRPWGPHAVFEVDAHGRLSLPPFNPGTATYAKELLALGALDALRLKVAALK